MSGRVKRMEGLIEGILQYSRAGRESLVAETVDLNTLVREIVDSEFHFAGVRFEIAENLRPSSPFAPHCNRFFPTSFPMLSNMERTTIVWYN